MTSLRRDGQGGLAARAVALLHVLLLVWTCVLAPSLSAAKPLDPTPSDGVVFLLDDGDDGDGTGATPLLRVAAAPPPPVSPARRERGERSPAARALVTADFDARGPPTAAV